MITLSLPYPVSANRYWRSYRSGARAITTLSAEAQAYKTEVGWLAKAAGIKTPYGGRVTVEMTLYPALPKGWKALAKNSADWHWNVRCIDLDNSIKVTIDALNKIAYNDDKQISRIVAERGMPDGEARMIVNIIEI